MRTILALDPGLTKPGVALYADNQLVSADRLRVDRSWSKLEILDRSERVAQLAIWLAEAQRFEPQTVIVEWPQWYGGNEKGIDPNDLAGLCAIAGAAAAHARRLWGREVKVCSPKPREVWGSVPKQTTGDPWASPRGARLASRLTPGERAVVADYHDALDAAGLALFAAGRWKRQRLAPGAV